MVTIHIDYQGQLRCHATHGPSSAELLTDAPTDNHGQGAAFSPTDLVATALGSCMATILAIGAEARGFDPSGTTVTVEKSMVADPLRRIGRLEAVISIPRAVDDELRSALEAAARSCPVAQSLHPDVALPVTFHWGT